MSSTEQNSEPFDKWKSEFDRLHADAANPGFWESVQSNCDAWAKHVSVSPFWHRAKELLPQWRSEYINQTGASALLSNNLNDFCGKSSRSIQDKMFRRYSAIESTAKQITEVQGSWNCNPLSNINDLVRTRVVCKFIDGVEFIAGKLIDLAKEMNCFIGIERKGEIQGYFAQHITFTEDVYYRYAGGSQPVKVLCEIQIATEMATQVWDANHPIYELVRANKTDPENWQWQPNNPQFIANQLGHMIHLADGLLVQLREQLKRREK